MKKDYEKLWKDLKRNLLMVNAVLYMKGVDDRHTGKIIDMMAEMEGIKVDGASD